MAFVVLTTRRCGSSKGVVGEVAGEHSVGFGMVALRWFWDGRAAVVLGWSRLGLRLRFVRAWVCVCVLFASAFWLKKIAVAFVVLTTRRCGSSKGVVGDVAGEHARPPDCCSGNE